MSIASRTPEGCPNHCPICNADVCIEPSLFFGDATCPNCGSLLWFLNAQDRIEVFEHSASHDIRSRVVDWLAEQLGVDPTKLPSTISVRDLVGELGADSLDITELVMELEEELDL